MEDLQNYSSTATGGILVEGMFGLAQDLALMMRLR